VRNGAINVAARKPALFCQTHDQPIYVTGGRPGQSAAVEVCRFGETMPTQPTSGGFFCVEKTGAAIRWSAIQCADHGRQPGWPVIPDGKAACSSEVCVQTAVRPRVAGEVGDQIFFSGEQFLLEIGLVTAQRNDPADRTDQYGRADPERGPRILTVSVVKLPAVRDPIHAQLEPVFAESPKLWIRV
jgi:hypothetical protein